MHVNVKEIDDVRQIQPTIAYHMRMNLDPQKYYAFDQQAVQ